MRWASARASERHQVHAKLCPRTGRSLKCQTPRNFETLARGAAAPLEAPGPPEPCQVWVPGVLADIRLHRSLALNKGSLFCYDHIFDPCLAA